MAAGQPFSLFPRGGVPKLATPSPHKRNPSLHAVKNLYGEENLHDPMPSGTEAIPLRDRPSTSRTPSPENIGVAVSSTSPITGTTPSPRHKPTGYATPPPPPPPPPPAAKGYSPNETSSGRTGSATLVQDTGASPVVPFRSMFPRYNPSVPLNQQSYYPQRSYPQRQSSLSPSIVSRREYRHSMATPIDRQLGNRTRPPSVVNFHDTMSMSGTPQLSSHRELEKLWEASHGTEPSSLIKSFDLEMNRTSEATFCFGADPQYPFYTLQTFDTNEISVSKTNPVKRADVREVVLSAIEPQQRRLPPQDGLVSFIFPKMAAMMALNQSTQLAKTHQLAPTDKDDVEAAAIRRAAAQEACHLRWNPNFERYEFEHPAIARRPREPDFLKSPASATNSMILDLGEPILHINVSAATPNSAPVISVIDPNASTPAPQNSPNARIRLSVIPQSDIDRPLASLDLGTQSLHIDADQILTLMPSLFSIDCVVCAIMAVAIAHETTNTVIGSLPIWKARPKAPASQYGGSVKSYAGSAFYATLAERDEAESEARQMEVDHKKDIKESRKAGNDTGKRTWYGAKKRDRSEKKTKKVMVGEFDLEKLGHYQKGDRKGQELPPIVRGLMSVMVGVLRFVTWLLTLIVGFICWLLVGMTRCVTSEKF